MTGPLPIGADARRPPDRLLDPTGASWDGESVGAPSTAPQRTPGPSADATRAELRAQLWTLQQGECVHCRRPIRHATAAMLITARTLIALLRRHRQDHLAELYVRVIRRAAAMVDRSDVEILEEPIAVVHAHRCFAAAVLLAHPTLSTAVPVVQRLIRRTR